MSGEANARLDGLFPPCQTFAGSTLIDSANRYDFHMRITADQYLDYFCVCLSWDRLSSQPPPSKSTLPKKIGPGTFEPVHELLEGFEGGALLAILDPEQA